MELFNCKIPINEVILILLILILLSQLRKQRSHYTGPDPLINRIKHDLIKLHPKAGELRYFPSDKSFTEDKKDMYLCLKDENGVYYPYNMLMYVGIHELAHAISHKVDTEHTGKEFNENFDYLLQKAEQLGIYDSKEKLVQNYCGISAND